MARVEELAATGGERRWTLHLPPLEARLVAGLPDQLARLLGNPGENRRVIDRLFPKSYDDPREEAEHRRLLGESLLEARRETLAAVRAQLASAARDTQGLHLPLGEATADTWLRFLNDVRLIIATDLDVKQNLAQMQLPPGHPDAPRYTLLVYLGGLESVLLEAVTGQQGI